MSGPATGVITAATTTPKQMMHDEHKNIEEDEDEPNAKDIEEEVKSDKIKAPRAVIVNKSH
jgi:hypothetical protein